MKHAKKTYIPRRSPRKPPPSWCMYIEMESNGGESFLKRIYFGAYHGGLAKVKALPKLQGFLGGIVGGEKSSFKISVLLQKVPMNGNGNGGAPSYCLRERFSYMNSIMGEHRPSKIFKTI